MNKKELSEKTKQELLDMARKADIAGRSKMNKEELVSSLAVLFKGKNIGALKKAGSRPLVSTRHQPTNKVAAKKKEPLVTQKAKKESLAALPSKAGKAETWQEKVEDTKFYLGTENQAFVTKEELPEGYGDNRVVLMVRDPHWAYAYWDINNHKIDEARRNLKSLFDKSRLILRVYDVTGLEFNGSNANSFFDIEVPNVLGNWYVNLGRPNRTFCIDIGYRMPDGGVFVLSRSNKITSPRETLSEVSDEEWISSYDEYKKIFAKSGGIGRAGSSAELAEMMKRRLEKEISSGGVRGLEPKETFRKH